MINLERIATGDISGLDGAELEFVSKLSTTLEATLNQYSGLPLVDDQLVDSVLADLRDPEFSLRELDEQELALIKDIEKSSKSASTLATTRQHVQRFKKYLVEKNLPDSIEDMPIRYVDSYLRLWYVSLRKVSDDTTVMYAPDTIRGFRASIHRHMVETRAIEVIGNEAFRRSNETYSCILRLSCQGRQRSAGDQTGFQAIAESDMKLLNTYFNRRDPERLQDEVFFNIVYHFGFRGREWIRNLQVSSLQFAEHNGVRCVDMVQDGPEKTITAASADKFSTAKQIRMFATDGVNCPVAAVEFYLSKFPPNVNVLFPKPVKIRPDSEFWYSPSVVVGKNKLMDKMKDISLRAGLEQPYTNHCVRATVVTNLVESGHTVQEIKAVTGHRSDASVGRYIKRISEKRKMELSHSLTNAFNGTAATTSKKFCTVIETSDSSPVPSKPTAVLEKDGARISFYL